MLRRLGILASAGAMAYAVKPASQSVLDTFGVDLTDKARRGELPEIIGRDADINTALETLLLIETPNPLLVGESGVGKSSIVEAIAARIASGNCHKRLAGSRVVELSAGRLLASTRLRGEFEERIQQVLAEARRGVILFIDEIHTIVGAGAAEGAGPDAGNMLKTALQRGDIRLIGATTHAEYRRTIARDKALSRRFQIQMISPPSRDVTIQILCARQKLFETFHEVRILSETITAAVDLSERYIVDRYLPAKARDVLERACVHAISVKGAGDAKPVVTPEHVAGVIARQVGLPLERLSTSDLDSLATLETRLNGRIFGQAEAVSVVADAIRRGRQGVGSAQRPWGVFLFVGPPGVGKTEMAKVLAEEMFGGPDGLMRFDMGMFAEAHSIAKLIGAPPGYIGYTQGAPLVEQLRKRPHSLLLFDEIEHAHENVYAILLSLLDEGVVSDPDGNVAQARNCVVILTSNLLAGRDSHKYGFSQTAEIKPADVRGELSRKLPVKLLDRLDEIVLFRQLTVDEWKKLIVRAIDGVCRRIDASGVQLVVSPAVATWLASKVAGSGEGGRAVQRTVNEHFGTCVSDALTCRPPAMSVLSVDIDEGNDRLRFAWKQGP
jgi:ATP-dependent Clp protease ATP-binding subunit ClpC